MTRVRQLTTLESITTLAFVIVHEPPYVAMLLAGALGPVLAGPGKQPPMPSGPSGTLAAVAAQPPAPAPPPGPTTFRLRTLERALSSWALPRKVARTL